MRKMFSAVIVAMGLIGFGACAQAAPLSASMSAGGLAAGDVVHVQMEARVMRHRMRVREHVMQHRMRVREHVMQHRMRVRDRMVHHRMRVRDRMMHHRMREHDRMMHHHHHM